MKKVYFLFYFIFSAAIVFAFTPHINKGKITKISLEQAVKEMKISEIEIKQLNTEYFGFLETFSNFPSMEEVIPDGLFSIYKQTFDETNETLYRVFIETCNVLENKETENIFQKVYYSNGKSKANLVFADYYNGLVDYRANNFSLVQLNTNVMPIIKNSRIDGIMIYGIESYTSYRHTDEYSSLSELSNKELTHSACVFWSNNFSTTDLKHTSRNKPDISIECSKPFIDEKDTFKYTIQNAFDKNSATSYVEDTEDDLMYVIMYGDFFIRQIAVINGYAQNNNLYFKNNRIKEITSEFFVNKEGLSERITEENRKYIINDNTLKSQVLNYPSNGYFFITDIYKGTEANDTCLAEFNVFTDEFGWILGE